MSVREPSAAAGWSEPASRLELHWGAYRPRLLAGLVLIIVGTGCILLTSAYSLPFLLAGSLIQPAGWALLPSWIGRRVAVVVPVLGFTWLMLGGASFAWCFAVPLAAWLLVRLRPLLSYVVLVLPIASSIVLARTVTDYSVSWVSILVSTLVVIAGAWLARWVAVWVDSRQSVRTLRKQADRLD
ncbi:hypothetical protein [Kitasatospora herbaricolor]|uniref:hypothetical protein n=1 Tax=Kitasatospora herbaricolor TaxID=68217 RepID=UPI0036DC8A5C